MFEPDVPLLRFALIQFSILMFADDTALLARSPEKLQSIFNKFVLFCNANGLRINAEKTKVLSVNC